MPISEPLPVAGKERILVIEDYPDLAESLKMLLELLGHEVRIAASGPEGVRLASEWLPDVVLSDIGLPGLDGFGVARRLRQNAATARIRLIAISAYGSEEDRRRARESGFDYHLTKPADFSVLLSLLAPAGR